MSHLQIQNACVLNNVPLAGHCISFRSRTSIKEESLVSKFYLNSIEIKPTPHWKRTAYLSSNFIVEVLINFFRC